MTERMPKDRLRNTRAWAAARVGQLSGAEVIVSAIDELLHLRQCAALLHEAAHVLIDHEGREIGEQWRLRWARTYQELNADQQSAE